MNIREMIGQTLVDSGHDGLYNSEGPCGCGVGDLFPCGEGNPDECIAAHKHSDGLFYIVPEATEGGGSPHKTTGEVSNEEG
jgi:hypothetical protein